MIRTAILCALLLFFHGGLAEATAADEAAPDGPAATAPDDALAGGDPTLEDGEREWGRDPGIGTTLSPASLVITGVASVVVIGLVVWLVSYRKPDGTVHPYDEG